MRTLRTALLVGRAQNIDQPKRATKTDSATCRVAEHSFAIRLKDRLRRRIELKDDRNNLTTAASWHTDGSMSSIDLKQPPLPKATPVGRCEGAADYRSSDGPRPIGKCRSVSVINA